MTYKEAKVTFEAKRKNRDGYVKLDRNTYLAKLGEREFGIILHATIIVRITPTMYVLNSGGWHTMTTAARMRDYVPFDIGARSREARGWQIYLVSDDLDCYCVPHDDGYEKIAGQEQHWTGTWELPNGEIVTDLGTWAGAADVKAIYEWQTCHHCQGSCKRSGPDYANGYAYYDGIRISANGKRLMSHQPAKPKNWTPVVTESGWTRTPLVRSW